MNQLDHNCKPWMSSKEKYSILFENGVCKKHKEISQSHSISLSMVVQVLESHISSNVYTMKAAKSSEMEKVPVTLQYYCLLLLAQQLSTLVGSLCTLLWKYQENFQTTMNHWQRKHWIPFLLNWAIWKFLSLMRFQWWIENYSHMFMAGWNKSSA